MSSFEITEDQMILLFHFLDFQGNLMQFFQLILHEDIQFS